jgi:aspartyl-tRNA(Asn)/glutamyl-tRNA(Gln) amidotransferase subunit A
MDRFHKELHCLSVKDISNRLAVGQTTAVELVNSFFAQLSAVNQHINAIVSVDRDLAMRQALASDERHQKGARLSPLDGIPVTIKDNLYTKELPTTWGSRAFAGWFPEYDDLSVQRLRCAGANVFAKTNTPEFALAAHTNNDIFGVTRNPWDLERTPGGSSGGAAAAIASGMGALAVGTDAGGSIRRPASYTGTVGFRPSTGRIPRVGGFQPLALDFQVVAPCARTVDDAYALFRIMAGPDARDRASLSFTDYPLPDEIPQLSRSLSILHVTGVPGKSVDAAIDTALHDASERLRQGGHRVTCAEAPYGFEEIERIWATVTKVGVARILADHPLKKPLLGPAANAAAAEGGLISAVDYLDVIQTIARLRVDFCKFFEQFDVILSPASAAMPWKVEDSFPKSINGKAAGPRDAAIFSTFVNAAGLPSISIPAPVSHGALPIGVQLTAAYGADIQLLQLAKQLEVPFVFPDLAAIHN